MRIRTKWKKKAAILLAIATASGFLLTGCGVSLKDMTPEEEALFVSYAAAAISRANRNQSYQTSVRPQGSIESNTVESDLADLLAGFPVSSLTDAIGIEGITANYTGYDVSDEFVQGGQLLFSSQAGFVYLVVNVSLNNELTDPVECNVFERNLNFRLAINGVEKSAALTTSLTNDLSTHMAILGGGVSVDTVLIFEIKETDVLNIQSMALLVNQDGADVRVDLTQ